MRVKYQLLDSNEKKNEKVRKVLEFLDKPSKLIEANIVNAIEHMNIQNYSLDSVKSFLKEFNMSVDSILRTEMIKKSNKDAMIELQEKRIQKDIHIQNCITISKNMSIDETVLKFILMHDICSCDATKLISKKIVKKIKKKYDSFNHASASAYLCDILFSDIINDCDMYTNMVAHHQTKKGGIIYLVDKVEKIQTKNIARKMKVKDKDKLIEIYKDKCYELIKKNEWYSIASFIELDSYKIIECDSKLYKITRIGKIIYVHKCNSDGVISDIDKKELYKLEFDNKKKCKKHFKYMRTVR